MAKRIRNRQILLRVSDTEYEMIKHRMELCNETNMNRYIRRMAIDGCVFNVDHTPIDNMNYELNKIGANINQIAYKVNSTGSIYESEMQNIRESMKTIWQLLKTTLLHD